MAVELISWLRYSGANGQHEFVEGFITMYTPLTHSTVTPDIADLYGIEIKEPIEQRLIKIQKPLSRSRFIRKNAHYSWISIPTDMCLSFNYVLQHGRSNVLCTKKGDNLWHVDIEIATGEGIPLPLYRTWRYFEPLAT
ncbi:MAG: hypothetical protein V4606_04940 [Patescibacteria group bacterium]